MMTPVRTLDIPISRSNVIDQLAQFFYATGIINHDEEIVGLEFPTGDLKDTFLLKIKFKKEVKQTRNGYTQEL